MLMIAPTARNSTGILRFRHRANFSGKLAAWALAGCALAAAGCSTPRDDAAFEADAGDGGGKTDAGGGSGGSSTGKGSGGGTASSGSGGTNGSGSGGSQNSNGSGGNQNNNGSGGGPNNGTGGRGSGVTASGGQNAGTGGAASGGMMMTGTGGAASGGMMMASTGGHSSGGMMMTSTGGAASGGMMMASTGGHSSGGMMMASTGGHSSGGMMMASTGGHSSGGMMMASTGGQGTGGMVASSGGSNPCGSNTCTTPPSSWTIGTTVNSGSSCPSGYSGTKTTLHSGTPKVSCSGGSCKCGLTPGSNGTGGFCQQNFQFRVASNVNYTRPARSDKRCYQLLADTIADDTTSVYQVYAFEPFYVACSGSSCAAECGAVVSTAPSLSATWDSSVDFCALPSSATSCGSGGKCTSGKLCLMATGNQSCPSGFTAQGSAGGWYTGTSGSPTCGCGGCGAKTAASCGIAVAEFYNQTCTAANYLGYFDFGSAGYTFDVSWPGRGLAANIDPPLPGTCNAAQVTSSGSFGATGQTTVCCN